MHLFKQQAVRDVAEVTSRIPIIDFGAYFAGEPGALAPLARHVRDACENIGFFYMAGHGVPREIVERTFAASRRFHALPLENNALKQPAEALDIADIRNSLKALMWRAAGVRRSGDMLRDAREQVEQWQRYVLVRQFDDVDGWELQNMLTISGVVIDAAVEREESRGTHQRIDHPQTVPGWNRHVSARRA